MPQPRGERVAARERLEHAVVERHRAIVRHHVVKHELERHLVVRHHRRRQLGAAGPAGLAQLRHAHEVHAVHGREPACGGERAPELAQLRVDEPAPAGVAPHRDGQLQQRVAEEE